MSNSDDEYEARVRWRSWVEKEIGGSPSRIEAVMHVVLEGVGQRKASEEIAASARQAAEVWDVARAQISPNLAEGYKAEPAKTGGIYDIVEADKSELGRGALAALDAIDLRAPMRAKAFFATKGFRGRYGFPGARPTSTGWFKFLLVAWLTLLVASITVAAPIPHLAVPSPPILRLAGPSAPILHPPAPAAPILHPPAPHPPIPHPPAPTGTRNTHQYIVWAILTLGLILVGRLFFVLVATPILAHRAIIEIRKGRIFLQYGLFDRKAYTAEVHWIREVTWAQSVVQKLFGEATIALHLDTPSRTVEVLALPGIVGLAETQGYVDRLRNAAQKLRQGQGRWFPGGFIN